MACIQIRSFHIDFKSSARGRTKRQELLADLEKFLNVNNILMQFGRFDDACQALIERAEEWRARCRSCEQVEIRVCTITFYTGLDMKDKIAVVDVLKGTHNAPHALLSRDGIK